MVGVEPYDALLVVSFGGPEGPDDVLPFLENVTRGRGVPRERLAAVAGHYQQFGGVSPINAQVRELIAAIRADFDTATVDLPIYWGNRNWHPMLADTVRRMAADGVRRAAAFVTAAYTGYSNCRQYDENIAAALAAAGDGAPRIDRVRPYFNHPGFVAAMTDRAAAALDTLPPAAREDARLVCTAHSVPLSMADHSTGHGGGYVAQLAEVAALVAGRLGMTGADVVFQSRSGLPSRPWLEPDIGDHLGDLHAKGADTVVCLPVGFVSDHLEVAYDLDTEAARVARRLGMTFVRAGTPGTHPAFVSMVRELVAERAGLVEPRTVGTMPACPPACPPGSCRT